MAESVATLFRRSLHHIACDVPASYHYAAGELGALVVEVDVDGELFTVCGGSRLDVVEGGAAGAGVRIATSRRTVVDVVDAELTLGAAVQADRVIVRGSMDDVLRAHDALIAYAHAAVRAPAVPGLMLSLRDGGGGG
jgi:hypothetical protein